MYRYNTIQYNTIQYNTIQYNTIQYNTIQYNTIQYNTIQYNTIHTYVALAATASVICISSALSLAHLLLQRIYYSQLCSHSLKPGLITASPFPLASHLVGWPASRPHSTLCHAFHQLNIYIYSCLQL